MEIEIRFRNYYRDPFVYYEACTIEHLHENLKHMGICHELLGRYTDADILRELEIRGVPENVLSTFKEYVNQTVVTEDRLESWLQSCK